MMEGKYVKKYSEKILTEITVFRFRNMGEWREIFDSSEPHLLPFPAPFGLAGSLTAVQKLCIIRCLRRYEFKSFYTVFSYPIELYYIILCYIMLYLNLFALQFYVIGLHT